MPNHRKWPLWLWVKQALVYLASYIEWATNDLVKVCLIKRSEFKTVRQDHNYSSYEFRKVVRRSILISTQSKPEEGTLSRLAVCRETRVDCQPFRFRVNLGAAVRNFNGWLRKENGDLGGGRAKIEVLKYCELRIRDSRHVIIAGNASAMFDDICKPIKGLWNRFLYIVFNP